VTKLIVQSPAVGVVHLELEFVKGGGEFWVINGAL
jgi:hypothetical protein